MQKRKKVLNPSNFIVTKKYIYNMQKAIFNYFKTTGPPKGGLRIQISKNIAITLHFIK